MNNIPTSPNDPVNTDILLVAEDRIKGFRRLPFHAISEQCGHPVPVVIQRLKAMMEAGVVRRVRQTLLATKLAQGALVACAASGWATGIVFFYKYLAEVDKNKYPWYKYHKI